MSKNKNRAANPIPQQRTDEDQRAQQGNFRLRLSGICIIVSLCVYWFFLMLPQGTPNRWYDGNHTSLYLFSYYSRYAMPIDPNIDVGLVIFKTRVLSQVLSGYWLNTTADIIGSQTYTWNGYSFGCIQIAFALWQASWLFLTLLAIWHFCRNPLLVVMGTFAGLMYNLTIPSGSWFYPYDGPAMFFFTLAVLLYDGRRILPLATAVLVGAVIKETVLCCALLILFGEHWKLKNRIAWFTGIVIAAMAGRQFLMVAYGVHVFALPFNESTDVASFIAKEVHQIGANIGLLFHLNSLIFANAGALVLMFWMGWKTRRDKLFKLLAGAFVLGQFQWGTFCEFRDFFEVLPLGWIIFSEQISIKK